MKPKKSVALTAVILLYAAALAGLIYMQKTGRAFIFFGILIKEFSSLYWLLAAAFLITLGWVLREKKSRIRKAVILTCLAALVGLFPVVYDTAFYNGKKRITAEKIVLSDDEKVLIDEVHDRYSEYHAEIFVYKIGGCIAKETGSLFEAYGWGFFAMERGCWEYTYDEAEKKLTIIVEYDISDPLNPYINKENDTGFLKQEFILE
ncbi:MAG: hypothetical protein NC395_08785 [Prevotella sp.]|nr:hypothetical protein [Prevotella sp.]